MIYSQHTEYCFSENLEGNGLPYDLYCSLRSNAEQITESIRHSLKQSSLPLFNILKDEKGISVIEAVSEYISTNFKNLVVIATGSDFINSKIFANFSEKDSPKISIFFIDNLDPIYFEITMQKFDYETTAFLVIDHSGNNLETFSLVLAIIDRIKKFSGKNYKFNKHFFFMIGQYKSNLRTIASDMMSNIIDYPLIASRFAPLSCAGLIVASILGMSIKRIRDGANEMVTNYLEEVTTGSALAIGMLGYSYNLTPLVTFNKSLDGFAKWYLQINSESFGKNKKGITPLSANCTSDNYGMLQLFMEGPSDKFFTFITYNNERTGHKIDCYNQFPDFQDITLGALNHQIQKNVIANIILHKKPSRILKLYDMDDTTIGALIMHFTLEAIVIAKLLQVNPFNHPGIQEIKLRLQQIKKDNEKRQRILVKG